MNEHRWTVEIYIDEDVDTTVATKTVAHAQLHTRDGGRLTGTGSARRNPHDPEVPEIGDEIAVSRALRDLAEQLLQTSARDVAEVTHEQVHLKP